MGCESPSSAKDSELFSGRTQIPLSLQGNGPQQQELKVCTSSGLLQAAWLGREEGQSSKRASERLLYAWLGWGCGAGRGQMQPLLLGEFEAGEAGGARPGPHKDVQVR